MKRFLLGGVVGSLVTIPLVSYIIEYRCFRKVLGL